MFENKSERFMILYGAKSPYAQPYVRTMQSKNSALHHLRPISILERTQSGSHTKKRPSSAHSILWRRKKKSYILNLIATKLGFKYYHTWPCLAISLFLAEKNCCARDRHLRNLPARLVGKCTCQKKGRRHHHLGALFRGNLRNMRA